MKYPLSMLYHFCSKSEMQLINIRECHINEIDGVYVAEAIVRNPLDGQKYKIFLTPDDSLSYSDFEFILKDK